MLVTTMAIPAYAETGVEPTTGKFVVNRADENGQVIENTTISVSNTKGADLYTLVTLEEELWIAGMQQNVKVPTADPEWDVLGGTSALTTKTGTFDFTNVTDCFQWYQGTAVDQGGFYNAHISIPAATKSGKYTVTFCGSQIGTAPSYKTIEPEDIYLEVNVVNTDEKVITVNGEEKNITQMLADTSENSKATALTADAGFKGNTKVASGSKVIFFKDLGLTCDKCGISVNDGEINYGVGESWADKMFVYIEADTGNVRTGIDNGVNTNGFLWWSGVTSLDDLKHSYTKKVTTPATCAADGKVEYFCENAISKTSKSGVECGAQNNEMTEVLSKDDVAHTWGEYTVTKAPTCAKAGEKSRTCGVCGKVETAEIAATGIHTYVADGEPVTTAAGTVQHTKCSVCGAAGPDQTTANNLFYLTATKTYKLENKGTDSSALTADQTCAGTANIDNRTVTHENDYAIESGKLVDVEFRFQSTTAADAIHGLDSTLIYDKENLELVGYSFDAGLTNRVTYKNNETNGTFRIQTVDAKYALDGSGDYLIATFTFLLKNEDATSEQCLPVDFVQGQVNENCFLSDGTSNYPLTSGIGFKNTTNHTVTWDWNYVDPYLATGETDPEDQVDTYLVGDSITQPENPARTGFEFKGWDSDDDDTANIPATTMGSKDLVYKALWAAKTYDVVFNKGDHGTLAGDDDADGKVTVETSYGKTPEAPEVTPANGYKFAGWDPELVEVTGEDPTLEYTATYEALPQPLKITFTSGDAIELPAAIEKEIPTDGEFDEAIPAIEGYTANIISATPGGVIDFVADEAAENVAGTMVAGGVTVEVKYSPNKVNITFNKGEHGTLAGDDDADGNVSVPTYYGKTPVAPEVTPAEGYEFTGWEPAIDEATEEVTYTAQYKAIEYDLTIEYVAADGSEVPEAYTAKVAYGTAVNETIPAKEGYTAKITVATPDGVITVDDVDDTAVACTMPASDVKVTVTYTPVTYDITFNHGDHGTIEGEDTDGNVKVLTDYGKTPKAPTVTPAEGYDFGGWTPTVEPTTGETTYTATYKVKGADDIIVEDYKYATTDMYMIRIPKLGETYDLQYAGENMFISNDTNYQIDGSSVFVYLIPKKDFDEGGIETVLANITATATTSCISIDYDMDTDENKGTNQTVDNNDATQVYQLLVSNGDCYTNSQVSIERRLESDTDTDPADATYRGNLKDVEKILAARGNSYN